MLPDLIKICSAVRSEGIFSSYSPIVYLLQEIFFSKFLNSVSGFIMPSFKPTAYVNVLKTDPNSYTPFVALLIKFISSNEFRLLRS